MDDAFADQWTVTKPAVAAKGGIVAAQNQRAARIGVAVLDAGGNAVDAAIATSFALGATEPWMSGLGGGGVMLVRRAGEDRVHAIDMGMVAPRRLDSADYPLTGGKGADLFGWPAVLEDRNLQGPLSICVPTLLAGLELARKRFGTMPLAELVTPAARLAEDGLAVDWYAALLIGSAAKGLAAFPASRAAWLPDGAVPYPDWTGTPARLPFPRLAETLRQIAAEGPDSFYRGDVAQRIVRDVEAMGGRLTLDDLALYEPRLSEALRVPYRDATIYGMPGPFAGVTLRRCLELLAVEPVAGPDARAYIAYAEALQRAYAERLAGGIDNGNRPSCTSHLCVVDRDGTLVSLTQTLLSLFGSKVVLPETGLLMNNGVMWFDPRPGSANSLAPGKRPLANMCPVIGEHAGRSFALGASGGRRILPAVLQLTSFLVDCGMDLDEAFGQGRIDASGVDAVVADIRLPEAVRRALAERFDTTEARPAVYPLTFACPTGVLRDASGTNHAAAEPMQPWAGAQAQG